MNIEIRCTSAMCPEQYDLLDGDEVIGQIRLRNGWLTCEYYPTDKTVYTCAVGDPLTGCFPSEEERSWHFSRILDAIADEREREMWGPAYGY